MPAPSVKQRLIADFASGETLTAPRMTELARGNNEALRYLSNLMPFEGTPQAPMGVFPVKVEKTGGTDGGVSSTASWTYTVRRVEWTGSGTSANFELGTAVAVYKPRPAGQMQYPTGDQHFGLAFWDSSTTPPTIILWDAGEYELTASTCDGT